VEPLRTTITRDVDLDVTIVVMDGRLDLRSAAQLRSVLLKCMAECPAVLIVDVSACQLAAPAAATVFAAVGKQQQFAPAAALMLVDENGRFRSRGGAVAVGAVPIYQDVKTACAAGQTTRAGHSRRRLELAPTMEAANEARLAVRTACEAWDIQPLSLDAQLVVSELVTNGVKHARTGVVVDIILREDYLHLRVRDGSTERPVIQSDLRVESAESMADHGRGVAIVQRICAGWGYVIDDAHIGKVVWATVRVRPIGAGPRS